MENIEKINNVALEKVSLAHPILNKLESNPELACFHDPVLSKMGESRWNRHFVTDTLSEIINLYSTINPKDMPKEVQEFVKGARIYLYGVKK